MVCDCHGEEFIYPVDDGCGGVDFVCEKCEYERLDNPEKHAKGIP